MSQENVERLRAAIDALRGDTSELDWEATLAGAWVELWDPEIEWDASTHPLPDLAGVYQGIDRFRSPRAAALLRRSTRSQGGIGATRQRRRVDSNRPDSCARPRHSPATSSNQHPWTADARPLPSGLDSQTGRRVPIT